MSDSVAAGGIGDGIEPQKRSRTYIQWDITVEILARLPVKSLMRFKCVSKSFYYLISQDSDFKKKHLRQSNLERAIVYSVKEKFCAFSCHPSSLRSNKPSNNDDVIKLDLPVEVGPTYISNSCDGLFCLRDIKGGIVVWNPHTRESKRLPDCLADPDPLLKVTQVRYGLGYDSISDDYKVLGVVQLRHEHNRFYKYQFKFYSMKKDPSWTKINDCFPNARMSWNYDFNFLNGAFHWIAFDLSQPLRLVALDIAKHKFTEFALPEKLCARPQIVRALCILREKLCVFAMVESEYMSLWVMEEYGNMESMRPIIYIRTALINYGLLVPVYLFEDRTLVIYRYCEGQQVVVYQDGGVISEENKQVFLYENRGIVCSIADCDNLYPYIGKETLISPHMSN